MDHWIAPINQKISSDLGDVNSGQFFLGFYQVKQRGYTVCICVLPSWGMFSINIFNLYKIQTELYNIIHQMRI
jgi:hypothetical protein